MKILSFYEFCALPPGTLFQHNNGGHEIHIKGETIFRTRDGPYMNEPIDFYEYPVGFVEDLEEGHTLEWGMCRDGLFEHDRTFIVYEQADVDHLQRILLTRQLLAES